MGHNFSIYFTGGGGRVGYPISQNGRMTHGKLHQDTINNRYGKPVQTPPRGAEVPKPECVEVVQLSMMTVDSGPTPRKGTTHTMSWPKEVDINWYEKPVQSQYWGGGG